MSTPYEIPITPGIPQQFTISLAGVQYTLQLHWCSPAKCWILDIYDGAGDELILGGLAIVTGIDLLSQYGYLNFGGQLFCQTDNNPDKLPTFTNLGGISHLYFVTTP